MDCGLPRWLSIAQAIGAPAVAVIAASIAGLIALQQWKTARDKLKLDLFDRRLKMYQAAQLLIDVLQVGAIERTPTIRAAFGSFKGSEWLVGPEVSKFLDDKILFPTEQYFILQSRMAGVTVSFESRDKMMQKADEISTGVIAQKEKLRNLFHPFLSFEHLRG